MVYAQPWRMTHINPLGLWHTNGSPNHGQKTRPYNNQQKKKKEKRTCKIVDFAILTEHRVKFKESEKKDNSLDFARELKKTMEHEVDNRTNRDWCSCYSHQRIIKGSGGLGDKRTGGDHPNYYIIENGQNTEKSLGNLRRLAVTQTPVKDHQLTVIWKTLKA